MAIQEMTISNNQFGNSDCKTDRNPISEDKKKVLIIVPAYNEQDNILNTVKKINSMFPQYDILVINDCSTDGTKRILIENNIRFLDLPVNLGIGGGVQSGYIYAFENGYDYAIQMDGDGQHPPDQLEKLMKPLIENKADIVIGSRYIEKKGFQSTLLRRIGIIFLSSMIYLFGHVRVLDVTSGYRAVNKEYIEFYRREYAQDYPEPEAIVMAARRGAVIKEVPVVMLERQGGKSSISSIKTVYYMIKVTLAIILNSMGSKNK